MNMKLRACILFAFATLFLPSQTPAMAEEKGFYAEMGYARFGLDILGRDFDPGAFLVRGGYQLTPFFGIEAEASSSLNGATIRGTSDVATLKFDQSLAGFAVARWPISPRVDLIGRVGYQKLDASIKVEQAGVITFQQKGNGEGFVYGGGVEYRFEEFGIRADYTWSSDASPFPNADRIETLSVTLTKSF